MSLRLEDLCNGSTPDSDSVCGGSNPSSSAKKEARCLRSGFSFLAEDEQDSNPSKCNLPVAGCRSPVLTANAPYL